MRAATEASSGKTWYFLASALQYLHLLGVLGGNVLGLAEVLVQVIELEYLVVERIRVCRPERLPRRPIHLRAQHPAVVIQRPLPHHLEVLGLVPRRDLGVLGVEGVNEAGAFDWRLLNAIDHLRRLDASRLEDRRHDVDHVDELLAQAPLVLDARRP